MRIALFDSGLGGLTVLSEAVKQLPEEDFLFFADTLHAPYGTKTKEQVQDFVRESLDQILREDIKALVIACNTATSAAAEELRQEYRFPIIGMEPAVKLSRRNEPQHRKKSIGRRDAADASPIEIRPACLPRGRPQHRGFAPAARTGCVLRSHAV